MKSGVLIVFVLIVAAVLMVPRLVGGGTAPTPQVFDAATGFEEALTESASTGRPVVAFVTADWCGACQVMKRGALVDGNVVDWLAGNAIPVYIDADQHRDLATQLEVRALPTTILIRDGGEISRQVGVVRPGPFLSWLQESGG